MKYIKLSLLAFIFTYASSVFAGGNRAPTDLDQMLVFISTTPFHSVDGSFLVDGMVAGDGLNFQMNVLKRSEDEVNASREDAQAFFMQRFGVDTLSPDVYFTGFEVQPDMNYRAVYLGGRRVPKNGYSVADGGWIVVVTNPDGIMLGGEFTGTHIPAGAMLVKGNYLIERSRYRSILLDYQALKPIIPQADGSFAVSCEVFSRAYGEGQAIGATLPFTLADGRVAYNTRNVITFPPYGREVRAAQQ